MPRVPFAVVLTFCLVEPLTTGLVAEDAPLIPEGSKLEELWNDGEFTEGVAVAEDGTVYFSDIAFDVHESGRIMKFDPKTGRTTVHSANSLQSNGLFLTPDGKLLAACGANKGGLGLYEVTPEGEMKVVVDRVDGKRFNAPNDLVVLPDGTVYFSDPRYVGPEPMELDHMSVFRVSPDRKTVVRATRNIQKPNGVHVSPDLSTLYVAETNNGSTDVTKMDPDTKKGRMTLNAFPIRENGSLGRKRVLVDFGDKTGVDGMTIDTEGRIYAAVRDEDRFGIRVFDPNGKELAYVATPALPTNCCFARGDDANLLYVTAGTGLYRFRFDDSVVGFHPSAKR